MAAPLTTVIASTSAIRFPAPPAGGAATVWASACRGSRVRVGALIAAPRLGCATYATGNAPGGWLVPVARARLMLCRTGASYGKRSASNADRSARPLRGAASQSRRSVITSSAVA